MTTAPRPRNRHLSEQEKIANRLIVLNWRPTTDAPGYFRKGVLRIIISEGDTLLSSFDELSDGAPGRAIEWEISFGPDVPWRVVMAAVNYASEGSR